MPLVHFAKIACGEVTFNQPEDAELDYAAPPPSTSSEFVDSKEIRIGNDQYVDISRAFDDDADEIDSSRNSHSDGRSPARESALPLRRDNQYGRPYRGENFATRHDNNSNNSSNTIRDDGYADVRPPTRRDDNYFDMRTNRRDDNFHNDSNGFRNNDGFRERSQIDRRDSRDDREIARSKNDMRRISRSPTTRSPANFSSSFRSSSSMARSPSLSASSTAAMPILNTHSSVFEVCNWIGCLKIDGTIKSKMIDLVDSERVTGATFCTFKSIEEIQLQFGVQIPLCERNLVRDALKNFIR